MSYLYTFIFLIFLFKKEIESLSTSAPIWLTSPYMRAGNQNVIKTLTGNSVDPIYTFTFSSALPGVPYLAYGIKLYQGTDTMMQQKYQIRRLQLTASTFKVQVDIIGSTTLHILNVPYVAIDPTFPHHLNTFDNVPINYGTTLVNFTTKRSGTMTFQNTINYTQQAAGRKYNSFAQPLTGNKILMFICALHITSSRNYILELTIDVKLLTQSTYHIKAVLKQQVAITKLHFSQIVFNSDDVQSSKKYFIVFQLWTVNKSGGFLSLPIQFVDNFIMGVFSFKSVDGSCGFQYQWNYKTINNIFGMQISQSVQRSGNCGFNQVVSSVFYMKTWKCPDENPYFNLTTNLCQDECDIYYFQNLTTIQCNSCPWACSICQNSISCLNCNKIGDHRQLKLINNQSVCVCIQGYFQDPNNSFNKICLSCISNCLICSNIIECELCNETAEYLLLPNKTCLNCGHGCTSCNSEGVCVSCKPGLFYNSTTAKCQQTCSSYFFANNQTNRCQNCNFACISCNISESCLKCDSINDNRKLFVKSGVKSCQCTQRYYQDPLNINNKKCLPCLQNCLKCNTSTICELCDQLADYILSVNKQKCLFCGIGCNQCEQQNLTCLSCKKGFLYDQLTKQCFCPLGTYKAETKNGLQCKICDSTCGTCAGPSLYQCTSCNSSHNRIPIKLKDPFVKCDCNSKNNFIQSSDATPVCVRNSLFPCDQGYSYSKFIVKCIQICGDGKNLGQYQCDDGNNIDGDGCSTMCKIQKGFKCTVIQGKDFCQFIDEVTIISATSFKYPFSNTLLISCQLYPIYNFFYSIKWKNGLELIGPKMSIIDAWMEGKLLKINSSYFQDLSGKKITIKYSSIKKLPQSSQAKQTSRKLFSSNFNFDITLKDYMLPINPINNLKPIYLQQNTYNSALITHHVAFIIVVCVLIVLLLLLFLKTVFPILQILLGLQLIFLSLGTIKNMNPLLSILTQFSPVKGVRTQRLYFQNMISQNQIIEYNMQSIGYVTSFFNNTNIILFINLLALSITFILYLFLRTNIMMFSAFKIINRNLMIILLMSGMNLFISLGLVTQKFYAFQLILAILSVVILAIQICYLIKNLQQYYYFRQTFDLHNNKIRYFIGTIIIVRLLQALLISILRSHTLISSICIFLMQIVLSVYFTIVKPYKSKIYNLVTIICEWLIFTFLIINLIWNTQITSQVQIQKYLSFGQISINFLIAFLLMFILLIILYNDYLKKIKKSPRINLWPQQQNKKIKKIINKDNDSSIINIKNQNQQKIKNNKKKNGHEFKIQQIDAIQFD